MQWGALHFSWLFIVLAVLLLFTLRNTSFKNKFFSKYPAFAAMLPVNPTLFRLKQWCALVGFVLLIVALMRPQWGIKEKNVTLKGQDIIFAMDVSISMYARDLKPDRLTRAKNAVVKSLDTMSGNRVALTAFAYSSSVVVPLTLDYTAVKNAVTVLSHDSVAVQGTNFNAIIELAAQLFKKSDRKRFLILITDGEDHEGNLEEALRFARESNIIVYTVGVGSEKGDRIPLGSSPNAGFKTDRNGNFVVSKVNPSMLRMIAEETGGQFFYSNDVTRALIDAVEDIASSGSEASAQLSIVSYEEKYMIPALLACVLLLTSFALTGKQRRQRTVAVVLFAFVFLNGFTLLDNGNVYNNKGIKKYTAQDYQGALDAFLKAKEYAQRDPKADYNTGTALYQLGQFDEAIRYFEGLSRSEIEQDAQDALFNSGNAKFRNNDTDGAIALYKEVLRRNPDDTDAKKNLEIALKRKQEEQQQQQQQQQQENKKDGQSNDQQNKSNQEQEKKNDGKDSSQKKTDSNADSQGDKQKVRPESTLYENLLNNLKDEETLKQQQLMKKQGDKRYDRTNPAKDW